MRIRPPSRRIGILLSGRGSNFDAIAEGVASGALDAEIALVVSDRIDAPGLESARTRGLEVVHLSSAGLDRATFDQAVADELVRRQIALICLAGFMRILSPGFIRRFPNAVLNIHPSLLPAFPGLDAQQQALDHGVRFSGCTVHFVDESLDGGPIVRQAVVPVLPDDDAESLSARILVEEHGLYPDAIDVVLSGRCEIRGRRVVIRD